MGKLHSAMVLSLITASLLAAAAIFTPTLAKSRTALHRPDGRAVRLPPPAPGVPRWAASTSLTRFDPPPEPWLAGHRGVDLAAGDELPVTAAGSGTVVFAEDLAGRGVISIVHANGLRTTYEPVEPLVAAGDAVTAGQTIGHLQPGHASCPGQACLHLGLKRGPLYLDPMLLFGSGKVRLLPRPGKEGRASEHRTVEHRTAQNHTAEPPAAAATTFDPPAIRASDPDRGTISQATANSGARP